MLVSFSVFSAFLLINLEASGLIPQFQTPEMQYIGRWFDLNIVESLNFSHSTFFELHFPGYDNNTYFSLGRYKFMVQDTRTYAGDQYFRFFHDEMFWVIHFPHVMTTTNDEIYYRWNSVIEPYFNATLDISIFDVYCGHLTATCIVSYDDGIYASLGEAWNARDVKVLFGIDKRYNVDINYEASLWGILGRVLSLGITSTGWNFIDFIVSTTFYASVAFLGFLILTKIIPGLG